MLKSIKTLNLAIVAILLLSLTATANQWAEPEKVEEVMTGQRHEAKVTWWGFDQDDATEYLQTAIDSGVPKLTVPYIHGLDWVVRPIDLTRNNQTLVFERGVVVRGKEGSITGRGDNLFHMRGRSNVTLSGNGATLRMPFLEYLDRGTGIGGHLVFVDGSENVLIEGLTLKDGLRDGIYVGGHRPCRNVTVRKVVADGNSRQGISIVSVDGMLVENSVFQNTRGKGPGSGIDAETHSVREQITNVIIRDNQFINNHNYGIHNWHSGPPNPDHPLSILWENNLVRGGQVGIHVGRVHEDVPGGSIVFRNNVVEETRTAGILIRSCALEAGVEIEFIGNVLNNTSIGELDEWWMPKAPIVLHSRGGGRQGNIRFENTIIRQSRPLEDRPAVLVDSREDFEGWENVTGTILVDVPGEFDTVLDGTTATFNLEIKKME